MPRPSDRLYLNKYNRALHSGELVRARHCSSCGAESEKMHGHHRDYSQPLIVEWLCPACHSRAHALARPCKTKATFYIERDLYQQLRGAVHCAQLRGVGPHSMSELVTKALDVELGRLRDVLEPETGEFPRLTAGRKGRPKDSE